MGQEINWTSCTRLFGEGEEPKSGYETRETYSCTLINSARQFILSYASCKVSSGVYQILHLIYTRTAASVLSLVQKHVALFYNASLKHIAIITVHTKEAIK